MSKTAGGTTDDGAASSSGGRMTKRWVRLRIWDLGIRACGRVGNVGTSRIPWCVFLHPHALIADLGLITDEEFDRLGWEKPT